MTERKRLLVTGSRDWDDVENLHQVLAEAAYELGWRTTYYNEGADPLGPILVSGACPSGADRFAEEYWEALGLPIERHPADWNRHGKAAGPIRNQEMVDLGADLCVAFRKNNSRGTTHCANAAQLAGIPVWWVTEGEEDA